MKNSLLIFIIALTIGALWHIKVAFSSDIKISGFFQVNPNHGYAWEKLSSTKGGVGVSIDSVEGNKFPVIQEVVSGGPAQISGLQPIDVIVGVNGYSTENWSKQQFVNALRGEIGTTCSVLVKRNGITIPITIWRGRIKSIDDEQRLQNSYNSVSHFFWDNTDVKWCPGFLHPDFKVKASDKKGDWSPLPGYKFVEEGDLTTEWQPGQVHSSLKVQAANRENSWLALPGYKFANTREESLTTQWEPGQQHRNYNALAADAEGLWTPLMGYSFVMGAEGWTDVIWESGQGYDNLKLISGKKPNTIFPYAGYRFVNSDAGDLDVYWAPSTVNPNDQSYVAGDIEGTWELKTQPQEITARELGISSLVKGLVGIGLRRYFGKNKVSNALFEESVADGIEAVKKTIKE